MRVVRGGFRRVGHGRRRGQIVTVLLVASVVAVMSACGADVANTGSGSPEEDLRRLGDIAEQSASAGGTVVVGKPEAFVEVCQRPSDGSSGRGARLVYSLSLDSTSPTQVGTSIGDLWRQKGHEWLGAEASVDDSRVMEE
jgi:hypothetical protein